jgi:hypothetical protein
VLFSPFALLFFAPFWVVLRPFLGTFPANGFGLFQVLRSPFSASCTRAVFAPAIESVSGGSVFAEWPFTAALRTALRATLRSVSHPAPPRGVGLGVGSELMTSTRPDIIAQKHRKACL